MKNITSILGIWMLLLFVAPSRVSAMALDALTFRTLPTLNELPSKEVQSIYQDREGYLWICTRNGLFQYDGYSLVPYKSNLHHSDLLTSNSVYCVAEDADSYLWIGTYNGLNRLDKRTGTIRKYGSDELNSAVICQILVTTDNRVLLASERGLFEYCKSKDRFRLLNESNTGGVLPTTTIKSLLEDKRGDIWIGTWSQGLFRWEKERDRYIHYPRMNAANSAHVLHQDIDGRIWVGTWGCGLQLLHHPYEPERTTCTTFMPDPKRPGSLSDKLIYSLGEDPYTHTLWVGTRSAVSILSLKENPKASATFTNYFPEGEAGSLAGNEVTSLHRDKRGLMWVSMMGGGVNTVNTRLTKFHLDRLPEAKRELRSNSVRSMLIDNDGDLWMGIGTAGFGKLDRRTGHYTHFSEMPDFRGRRGVSTVNDIMQSPTTGRIYFSIYDGGILEYDKHAPAGSRVKHHLVGPWLQSNCVFDLYEDSDRNLWAATRFGISMRRADGTPSRLDSLKAGSEWLRDFTFVQLAQLRPGELWAASNNKGIVRITGKDRSTDDYALTHYSTENGKLDNNHLNCLFYDSQGRLWAGTNGNGLTLYSVAKDAFIPLHLRWNLPGDAVVSIQEDISGHLWLGTNAGLVKLNVSGDAESATYRLFTTIDGLQDNFFYRGASTAGSDGELFFGGHQGYNHFYPQQQGELPSTTHAVVTDFKVYNRSWSALPAEERTDISAQAPGYTEHICLNHEQNNFSFEFSALEFLNPERNVYAYKLAGFDDGWWFTDATKRFAYYNNLPPGSYTFQLYSSNAYGIWDTQVRQIRITILPPPWKTWWAYTLYILVAACVLGYTYRAVRNRIRLRQELHLRAMEQAKMEELNHAKLQFFTNITHELLTPLTILSASVDELRHNAPQHTEQYDVMTGNINRLIRLLQQILEFRKAETGNLKLRVSRGDLARFVRRSLESFRPLMKKKEMEFACTCTPDPLVGYFDPDKLDKILYNLFSNASKYNRPGGKVSVELTLLGSDNVRLVVRDNGPGISKEAQKELFKRFYEGDYRKFKTIGTGIGLSLVRDLVQLHHGTIVVESEEGEGTAFLITLPIEKAAYLPTEVEEVQPVEEETAPVSENTHPADVSNFQIGGGNFSDSEEVADNTETATLLLVEDNEELLSLMVRLLSTEYRVFTATNGLEALQVMEQQDIDLVISDVMMPEMDGIELCRRIKGHFDTSHIPLLLLTAKNQEEDRVEAYENGADGFITKPFSHNVLHARIANLLRSHKLRRKEFKHWLVFEAKELDYTGIDEEFMQRAIECVNRHLDDSDFDQTRFIEEMGTSKSTLYKKLKSLTGLNTSAFIRNIRLKAACRIMDEKGGDIRIADLAYAVGFNDPKYFSTCFKKEFGVLPTEYKKEE